MIKHEKLKEKQPLIFLIEGRTYVFVSYVSKVTIRVQVMKEFTSYEATLWKRKIGPKGMEVYFAL